MSSTGRTPKLALRLDVSIGEPAADDLRDSVSANTWRAYRSDLADFDAWCKSKRRRWSKPESVAAYFRELETAGAAYATIERRKTAIAKLVEAEAVIGTAETIEDPTKHPKVTVTLKAIRRRIGTDQDRATPLTADRLIQVLLAIDETSLAGQRDIALLLTGWYGAFRRSELSQMRRPHLKIDDHGVGIEVPRSKTAQDHSVWVPILRQASSRWDPVAAVERWLAELDERGLDEAAGIWLHVTKGDTFASKARPISGDAINNIVGRRVLSAGLEGAAGYSAHSLRSGFVTEAKNRGIDEADIMKHSRHKSLEMMRLYDRTSGWWNRNATSGLAL